MPIERKIFKLGALAAGPLILVACSAEKQQNVPPTPPQYVDNPTNQPKEKQTPLQPTNQNRETPKNPATHVPTITAPSEKPTTTIDVNNNLVVSEKGYKYTIYTEITLNKLVSMDLEGFLSRYIGSQPVTDIRSLLVVAKQKESVNSQDPTIIKNVNSAANILNAHCNNNVYARAVMGYLASYLYLTNPQDLQNNKIIYLDGPCFWGEKTTQ